MIEWLSRLIATATSLTADTNYVAALVVLDQAEAIVKGADGEFEDVDDRILAMRAQIYRDTRQPDLAIGAYDRLAVRAAARGDSRDAAQAQLSKVVASMNFGRLEEAVTFMKVASVYALKVGDRSLQPEIGFWWARIYEEAGRPQVAQHLLERRVLRLSEEFEPDDMRTARHAMHMRLCVAYGPPDFTKGEASLERSLALLSGSSPVLRIAQGDLSESLFLVATGDLENGERKLAEAKRKLLVAGIANRQVGTLESMLARAS